LGVFPSYNRVAIGVEDCITPLTTETRNDIKVRAESYRGKLEKIKSTLLSDDQWDLDYVAGPPQPQHENNNKNSGGSTPSSGPEKRDEKELQRESKPELKSKPKTPAKSEVKPEPLLSPDVVKPEPQLQKPEIAGKEVKRSSEKEITSGTKRKRRSSSVEGSNKASRTRHTESPSVKARENSKEPEREKIPEKIQEKEQITKEQLKEKVKESSEKPVRARDRSKRLSVPKEKTEKLEKSEKLEKIEKTDKAEKTEKATPTKEDEKPLKQTEKQKKREHDKDTAIQNVPKRRKLIRVTTGTNLSPGSASQQPELKSVPPEEKEHKEKEREKEKERDKEKKEKVTEDQRHSTGTRKRAASRH